MPTYLYETLPRTPAERVERFEVKQHFSEAPLETHPTRGVPVRRVISGGMGYMPAADGAAAPSAGCGPANCRCGKFD